MKADDRNVVLTAMEMENGYLSDEALEQLMLEVEEHELVSAPPGFMDGVLAELEKIETYERKIVEFQKYCIRVITSAAAAIAILFALPGIEAIPLLPQASARQEVLARQEVSARQEIVSRQEVSAGQEIPARQEVTAGQEIPSRQECIEKPLSKEEVLNDSGFLTKIIGSLNYGIGGFSNETEK